MILFSALRRNSPAAIGLPRCVHGSSESRLARLCLCPRCFDRHRGFVRSCARNQFGESQSDDGAFAFPGLAGCGSSRDLSCVAGCVGPSATQYVVRRGDGPRLQDREPLCRVGRTGGRIESIAGTERRRTIRFAAGRTSGHSLGQQVLQAAAQRDASAIGRCGRQAVGAVVPSSKPGLSSMLEGWVAKDHHVPPSAKVSPPALFARICQ